MKNELISTLIVKEMPITECAKKLGISGQGIYNKLKGKTDWKITELLSLSRILNWTVEQFLDIIEYKEG